MALILIRKYILLLTVVIGARAFAAAPDCDAESGRLSERFDGKVARGEALSKSMPGGWIFRLVPGDYGWLLLVSITGREEEDISRLTPARHFVPNPRQIEGWHFRNSINTAPNDGSINARQELREFVFSPEVGVSIGYNGSVITADDVDNVGAFGRGWFYLESFELTPPAEGQRAAFESITFSACLTWPA